MSESSVNQVTESDKYSTQFSLPLQKGCYEPNRHQGQVPKPTLMHFALLRIRMTFKKESLLLKPQPSNQVVTN